MLAAENVSTTPIDFNCAGSTSTVCETACNTDGCTRAICRRSISDAPATAAPASSAACTLVTSPVTTIKNLPEQMLRAISSRTLPAFSI